MKRFVLYVITFCLALSMVAPAGAAFALEASGGEISQAEQVSEVSVLDGDDEAAMKEDLNAPVDAPAEVQALSVKNASKPEQVDQSVGDELVTKSVNEEAVVEASVPEKKPDFLAPQRKVFVTAFQTSQSLGFVELYNNDSKTQSIDGWKMLVMLDDGSDCEVELTGYILQKDKVLMAQKDAVSGLQNALIFDCGDPGRVATEIEFYDGEQVVERLTPSASDKFVWARNGTTATYLTGNFAKDFKSDPGYSPIDGYWYIPPPAPGIKILEVLVNPRQCLPNQEDPACYDFVKIKNVSGAPIDLSEYRMRTGFSNASSSSSNTSYFSLILEENEIRTLTRSRAGDRISITANDGTVWFEDIEGVVTYPTEVPPYVGSDLTSRRGLSWAFDHETETWRWAIPSPLSADSHFPEEMVKEVVSGSNLKPCRADQYRSPETNRCRNNAQTKTLAPCKAGQVRNPETNRCRSTATLTSGLAPCRADQFRNPETNRCKKIAATTALADCGEGRERNPETNRCRNIARTSPPSADFAVEAIKEPASVFIGWAVLGGITLLALGYAGWEWRHEIGGVIRRIPGIGRLIK